MQTSDDNDDRQYSKRCVAPSPGRSDNRCHNKSFMLGLCMVHLRSVGAIKTCGECIGSGISCDGDWSKNKKLQELLALGKVTK